MSAPFLSEAPQIDLTRPQAAEEEPIHDILLLGRPTRYENGEHVLVTGTQSSAVYYLEKGTIEVFHTVRDTKIVVALIGAGSFFGETGFFDGISRIRNVRAIEDSTILAFDRATLKRVQRDDPGLYSHFVTLIGRSVCAKFRRSLEEQEPLTTYAASLSSGRSRSGHSSALPSTFLQTPEWKLANGIVEQFKAGFFDLSFRLQKDPKSGLSQTLQQRCHQLLDEFNERIEDSRRIIDDSEQHGYIWDYLFKEVFPYFMRSRFAERSYFKPKGFAGDFLTIESLYRNQPEGDGKLGILVDRWCLNTPAARAVRGRRKLLSEQLETICDEKAAAGSPIRIMNLACGSNRELFDFLARCRYTASVEALCVDADTEALEYTNREVNIFAHSAAIRLLNDNVVKWAVGRIRHEVGLQDIIYSAGLTDYLDRRLFLAFVARCYEYLKPGGVLVIGNFAPQNPNKAFMDHVLQWQLIHRDHRELADLFCATPFETNVRFLYEDQQVNLFAVATRKTG